MFQIRICFANCVVAGALASAAFLQVPAARGATEAVVYSFCNRPLCTDGVDPQTGLLDVGGTLYGTTTGSTPRLFSLDPRNGTEVVLHSFASGMEPPTPQGSLINVGNTLYGVTLHGGSRAGSVFSFALATGREKTIYSFCRQPSCTDGASPLAGLINVSGTLYGTTYEGGAHAWGTVFSLNRATGAERIAYSFCRQPKCTDGALPEARLIDVDGILYGTTTSGGVGPGTGSGVPGNGTVFSLDPTTGTEKVLYSFCSRPNCVDGEAPVAPLINVGGILYGTTQAGGAYGYGVVFSLDPPTGAEKVMHSFCGLYKKCVDGMNPLAGLVKLGSLLYGTTENGGVVNRGTVFSLDLATGAERVLHSFCVLNNCADGNFAMSELINVGGALYGTTYLGGANRAGTVFRITP